MTAFEDPTLDEKLRPKAKKKVQKPSMYKVVILNDDYTSMDFVISILEAIFHKSYSDARDIMLQVHTEGKGICGVFTHEVAETKALEVIRTARVNEFPLMARTEEE